MPIGLPNCCRVLAYSTEVSSTCEAPPTISAQSAAEAHSSARLSGGQPWSTWPITELPGRVTPSSLTSYQRRVRSSVFMGVTVIPAGRPSTRKRVTPSSPESRVRAATTRNPATPASGTNSFMPSSFQPSPSRAARRPTPSASQRPEGSVRASVPRASPEAIALSHFFFWASVPASRSAGTARPMVLKKGPGRRCRPASSRTTTRSRKVPKPPCSSGMPRAVQPFSTSFFQRLSSKASSESMTLRTRLAGDSLARNERASFRSCSCSSENAKSIPLEESKQLARARQAEHPLGQDVAQHLGGAGLDGVAPRAQELVLPAAPVLDHAHRPHEVDGGFRHALVELRPGQLQERALGPGHSGLHGRPDRPVAVELDRLGLDPVLGDPLPDQALPRAPQLASVLDQLAGGDLGARGQGQAQR